MSAVMPKYADLERIESLIEASGFAAVIAAWPENVGYLSGFYHPDMWVNWERLHIVVWPSGGEPAFVVPRMRADLWNKSSSVPFITAEDTVPFITDIRGFDGEALDMVRAVADVLTDRGVTEGRLAVEFRSLPLKVSMELTRLLPHLTQEDGWPLLNQLRQVKTSAEVEVMTRANRLTADILEETLRSVRPGQTEREISARLAGELYSRGADELSHSILGVGPRAASWHPWPTGLQVEEGMLIRSDWGVRMDGYTSDIARNAVVGKANAEQKDIFARLSEAHDTVVAAVKPGVLASDLSALARREYARLGLEYRWGLIGHGIGLVIHEEPQLLLDVHDPIVEGMTMEIELGYFGDNGGYHIEDLIHVTANGALNLTQLDPNRTLIESES
ncbi:M24 family metallopeptidase [Nocardia sp.]|uniref:M24 family metallopeptidase n=1 Tax=Nocardia sp. TaxID=1821 RepID=UPI0026269A50|nr:Xaa-Pro peptidase family protein [Nocardia sp.]